MPAYHNSCGKRFNEGQAVILLLTGAFESGPVVSPSGIRWAVCYNFANMPMKLAWRDKFC